MDFLLIEILLWGGLLFFFWALKDGLSHVESDIESMGLMGNKRQDLHRGTASSRFVNPEHVTEPIGRYCDTQIYRYAVIEGKTYQFDRVCPAESGLTLDPDERWVAPGLVYQECADRLPA